MAELTSMRFRLKLDGVNWSDLTDDVLLDDKHSISLRYGNWSSMPTDLLAGSGKLNLDLDNSPANANTTAGRYSPGHASCVSGFNQGIVSEFSVLYSGTRYFPFLGWLDKPLPSPDPFNDPHTICSFSDWMQKASITKLQQLATQASKRADEGITTLLTKITEQPGATSLDTGIETFDTVFDDLRDEQDTIYSALAKLLRSEYGRAWIIGDTTQGGTLRFMNRHALLTTTLSSGTLSDDMDGLEIENDDGKTYDVLRFKITPRRYDASAVVLATLVTGNNYLAIGPGETKQITLNYRDPTGSARISGTDFVDPLEAGTDYKFGSVANGTSSDLNASLTFVSQILGGNTAIFNVRNDAAVIGYINLFKLRGKGIYPYDPYIYKSGSGDRVLEYDAPYLQSKNQAIILADYLKARLSTPARMIKSISFDANKSDALMTAALTGQPGTRWTIVNTNQGISTDIFINGVEYTITAGLMLHVRWCCLLASAETAWILGTSALDTDTILAV